MKLEESQQVIWIKAQTSMEAVFSVAVILVIFGLLATTTLSKQRDREVLRDFLEKKLTCDRFVNEVHNVFLMGNGTTSSVKLDHSINVTNGLVTVDNVLCEACCNVTRNSQSVFNLAEGTVAVRNINGDIIV